MSENYGHYQVEIYAKGAMMNVLPSVTTDPRLLEEQARKALGIRSFNYVAGGAGEKATMDSNRLAFRQWKMYVPTISSTKFGSMFISPLYIYKLCIDELYSGTKKD